MRVALVIGLAALLAGCAGGALAPSCSVAGQSGSIAWEVRGGPDPAPRILTAGRGAARGARGPSSAEAHF